MNDERPSILPDTLAAILEAAPGRVRKRLDREPTAGSEWSWERSESSWTVAAGEERVTIRAEGDTVRTVEQFSCTCLLSPNCFHVLACATALNVEILARASGSGAGASDGPSSDTELVDDARPDGDAAPPPAEEDAAPVTSAMQDAATRVRGAAADVLHVGARGAGTLVQSGLLRAGHQCRAAELPALGNAVLRVAEGIRLLRLQDDSADSVALRQDLLAAIDGSVRISRGGAVDESYVGASRREYRPTTVNRLEGWFAEPVLTRSGYAGVCVRFLAPSGDAYQVLDLRPGESQLVLQAYAGGIALGMTVESGRSLCRKLALVQRLGASTDGRLGRGTATRWVMQGDSSFDGGAVAGRFATPLARQIESAFEAANVPPERRRGGWDCLAFEARLLGAEGASIVVQVVGSETPWKLRIAIDRPELPFRENLDLLARCPGLRLKCVGRLRVEAAGEVDLLAIGPASGTPDPAEISAPRLTLPEEWQGRCNVGLDRLYQRHVEGIERSTAAAPLPAESASIAADDGLAALARRLDALALGGWRAIPGRESVAHRQDVSALAARGQSAAVTIIDRLGESAAALAMKNPPPRSERRSGAFPLEEAALAGAIYLAAARTHFHRERWLEKISER
ncbi:MAG TPA: hypothetical protein VGN57_22580 [Pirellulaceae bacterium]|jgi:hypothetical protein|nr:hypothetical protein [Pirellulaceae bacterium]